VTWIPGRTARTRLGVALAASEVASEPVKYGYVSPTAFAVRLVDISYTGGGGQAKYYKSSQG